jgi:hypothetical protein
MAVPLLKHEHNGQHMAVPFSLYAVPNYTPFSEKKQYSKLQRMAVLFNLYAVFNYLEVLQGTG